MTPTQPTQTDEQVIANWENKIAGIGLKILGKSIITSVTLFRHDTIQRPKAYRSPYVRGAGFEERVKYAHIEISSLQVSNTPHQFSRALGLAVGETQVDRAAGMAFGDQSIQTTVAAPGPEEWKYLDGVDRPKSVSAHEEYIDIASESRMLVRFGDLLLLDSIVTRVDPF